MSVLIAETNLVAHDAQNPSRSDKRRKVGVLALVGLLIAARLAAYQLGWTGSPWEPFFGDGTERVVDSSFSRALPFPDAALGVLAYGAEIVAVAWGSTLRWRTQPRVVYVYAAIAFGMGLGSNGLVVIQVAVIHAFCTLCLVSAFLSAVLVVPAATELRAAWQARSRS